MTKTDLIFPAFSSRFVDFAVQLWITNQLVQHHLTSLVLQRLSSNRTLLTSIIKSSGQIKGPSLVVSAISCCMFGISPCRGINMRQYKFCFLIDVTSGIGRIYASLCFNLYNLPWLITKIICI